MYDHESRPTKGHKRGKAKGAKKGQKGGNPKPLLDCSMCPTDAEGPGKMKKTKRYKAKGKGEKGGSFKKTKADSGKRKKKGAMVSVRNGAGFAHAAVTTSLVAVATLAAGVVFAIKVRRRRANMSGRPIIG